MSSQRFFKYFASERGRKFTLYTTTTACISAFCIKYFPHTFLIDKHKEIVASYQNGIERKVTDRLVQRLEIALNSLGIKDMERDFFNPYMATGFDLYSIGSSKFRGGALIGIPVNYTYTSADEIPKGEITVRGYDQVQWNSQGGKLLQEGLVLTEPEQIFGICKEILELKSYSVMLNSFYPPGAIFFYYCLTSTLNSRLKLFKGPLSLRAILYILVGSFTYGLYCLIKDATQVHIDGNTDETLAGLGNNFINAGYGFYSKMLKRNMAIRELTGSNDFTALGNVNSYFRTESIPLTMRKAYFEKLYKQNLKESEQSSQQKED